MSCDILSFFAASFGRKRSHHEVDASCWWEAQQSASSNPHMNLPPSTRIRTRNCGTYPWEKLPPEKMPDIWAGHIMMSVSLPPQAMTEQRSQMACLWPSQLWWLQVFLQLPSLFQRSMINSKTIVEGNGAVI